MGHTYPLRQQFLIRVGIPRLNLGFHAEQETGVVVFGGTAHEDSHSLSGKVGEMKMVEFRFKCASGLCLPAQAGATSFRHLTSSRASADSKECGHGTGRQGEVP